MEEYDMEFQKEQFKWQKQKFIILTAILVAGITFGSTMLFSIKDRSYRMDRESLYLIEKMRMSAYENEAKQEELSQRIRELELRNRNLEDFSKSLTESVNSNQELLLLLRMKIDKLQEGENATMVE